MILRRISLLVNGCEKPEYIAPIAKNLTYNGSSQELLTAGSTNDGIIYYSIDNSTWDVNVPSGTNAGSYTVYWKLVGDEGYCNIKSEINVTIAKADTTYTAPTAKSLTYNGSAQALLNAGAVTGGTIYYSDDNATWGTSIPTSTNADTYTSYWRIVGDSNHNDKTSTSISTTISKVTPTVVAPTAKVLTYNGSAQELVNAGSTDYGTLQYKVSSDSWSTSIPTRTRGGSYTVQYKVVGDSNINDVAAQSVQCSINEKQVTATVTLSQTAYTYNGSACEPSVTVSDGGVVIDPSEYTVTYSNNINAGTGTVTISDNVGGDYEVIGSSTFTINKADSSLSFAVTDMIVEVGKTSQNVVTVNAGDGTVTYSSNNTSVVTVDNNGSITGVSIGNAVITTNISSTSNYNSASTSYTSSCVEVITAKFNVTSTSNPTRIASATTSFTAIEIDGVKQSSVTTGYTFSTTGEHTVKYILNGTSIGNGTFYQCSRLISIDIPDSVTSIGANAFYNCTSLTSIVIPDSVTSIGNSAFYRCSGITSCTIGSGVTSIGSDAFYYCSCLTSIVIPDSVTTIGSGICSSCSGLTSITIGSGVTSISYCAFSGCTSLTSVTIPDNITTIGERAFNGCRGIISVTIPSGVTSIGSYAFYGCSSLRNVTVDATTPPTLGQSILEGGSNSFLIYVPTCSLVNTYKSASGWSGYSNKITSLECPVITAKINSTSNYELIQVAKSIENFNLIVIDGVGQSSVSTYYTFNTIGEHTVKYTLIDPTIIGNETFSGSTKITSIDIPNSVTSIGDYAFKGCSGLTSCTIGSGVTSIGNNAFISCYSLTSIDIPNSVTSIGNTAFAYCSGLTSCTIGSGVTSIGQSAFQNCTSLTSITIPSGVTSIGNYAFGNCSGLTSCTIIGNGVAIIGNSAFTNCYSLTSIDIPNSVTSIGNEAFRNCSGLTSCTIGSGVTSIGYQAFSGCRSLTSVTIPDSVTSIGSYAFNGCTSLSSCTIGSGVTSIGQQAFQECSGLTSITVNATTPPTLGNDAFYNTNYCPIYVPCDSVDTYKAASGWSSYSGRIQAIQGSCPLVAKFNVTDTSNPTRIASATTNFTKIKIDGVEQPSVTTGHTFSTTGEHIVKYTLTDPTSIGNESFAVCSGLTSIDIPSGVTSIGNYTFSGCTSLSSITIPSGVTSIGNYAFSDCRSLTSIDIPDSVTSISQCAFYGCSGLTSITIPSGVTSISRSTFWGCYSLTSVTIPNSVTSIGRSTFRGCTSLTNIDIPSGVTSIEYMVFWGCTSLSSITIPSGVTNIGDYVFANCSGLTSIVSNATTAPTITSGTFSSIKTGGTLYVPIGSSGYDVWMGTGDYYLGKYNWTKVEMPSGYKICEYIDNQGAAYIDTNITLDFTETIKIKISVSDYKVQWGGILGNYKNEDSNCTRIIQNNYNPNKVLVYFNNKASGGGKSVDINGLDQINTYEISSSSVIVNGTNTGVPSSTQGDSFNASIKLFAYYPSSYTTVDGKLYSFSISGKCNMIPCISPSNVVGLYDTVRNQFFSSANSTAFVAGPVIGQL